MQQPLTRRELERVELSLKRGRPLGDDDWTARAVRKLGLGHAVRREGRPSKQAPREGEGRERSTRARNN